MSKVVPEELNPMMLPSILLEQRRGLPSCSGIYFAISADDEVLYIGRSVNLAQRWISHHRHPELEEIGQVRIAWLEINEPNLLPAIEEALIDWFAPSLNSSSVMSGASVVVQGTAVKVLLKQIRKSKGLSQNELAQLICMSPQSIQKIE